MWSSRIRAKQTDHTILPFIFHLWVHIYFLNTKFQIPAEIHKLNACGISPSRWEPKNRHCMFTFTTQAGRSKRRTSEEPRWGQQGGRTCLQQVPCTFFLQQYGVRSQKQTCSHTSLRRPESWSECTIVQQGCTWHEEDEGKKKFNVHIRKASTSNDMYVSLLHQTLPDVSLQ